MWVSTQAFHVGKPGGAEGEYEDAYYPEDNFRGELKAYRCAVADGATESAFSREWARLLVRGYGQHCFFLRELQGLWRSLVERHPLPWYLASKITRGAHAAFVGLSLRDPNPSRVRTDTGKGRWRAFAVGDSCLFHVRGSELLAAGPVSKSEDFGSSPFLLSTTRRSPVFRGDPTVSVLSGTWEPKDAFYLASDAMAQWLLSEEEASRPPWGFVRDMGPTIFERVVTILRATGRLHNDDTTLLRIEVS